MRQARQAYFASLGVEGVDYAASWIELPLYGAAVTMPNPAAHGAALRLHDLHHVVTGYGTDLVGEAELGAWELAGGCGRYWAAFGFDLASLGLGMLLAPRRTYCAYMRGRLATNLFRSGCVEEWLERDVEWLRRRVAGEQRASPSWWARLGFGMWAALGTLFVLLAPLSWPLVAVLCFAPVPARDPVALARRRLLGARPA